jgi:hypothetical protein
MNTSTLLNEFDKQKAKFLETEFYKVGARDWCEDDRWLFVKPEEFALKFLDPLREKLGTVDVRISPDCIAPLLIVVRWRGIGQIANLSISGKRILISKPPASTMVSIAPDETIIDKGVYLALGVRIAPLPSEITQRDKHLDRICALGKHGVTADEAASLFFFFPEVFERTLEQRKRIVLAGAYWYSNLVFGGMGPQGPGIYCEGYKSISAGSGYLNPTQPTIQVCEYGCREFLSGERYTLMEATCDLRLCCEQ